VGGKVDMIVAVIVHHSYFSSKRFAIEKDMV